MELVVRKNDLLRELQLFQGIVERKNTIPILANVLMEAKGDEVRFLATDLEVGAAQQVRGVGRQGRVADAAGEEALRDRQVAAGDRHPDRGGQGRREGRGRPVRLADADAAARGFSDAARSAAARRRATLPRAALREMVAKTQFAITGEDTRYFLNGALFVAAAGLDEPGGDRRSSPGARHGAARGQGGEGRRRDQGDSSRRRRSASSGGCSSEGDGDIRYERGENHLFFDVGGRLLISRMIDGQFPAYERVIPKGNDKHIEFERDRLTNAVKRVALLSNERSRAVKFQIDKGKVDVTSSSPELGEAHETLPVDYTRRARCRSASTRSTCSIFSSAVATDVVSLELKDEVSQAVMKPVGAEGYDYTYVIMPMRV